MLGRGMRPGSWEESENSLIPLSCPRSSGTPTLLGMSNDGLLPASSPPDGPLARLLTGVLVGSFLAAILLPMRRFGKGEVRDSFPFSHYPMFSAQRKDHYWVAHLLGVRSDGTLTPLHYSYVGTGGLNAVRRQMRRRVKEGDGQVLAERAAEKIAARDLAGDRTVVRVHMVRGRYLVEPFMTGADREEYTSRLDVRGSADVPGREEQLALLDPIATIGSAA